MSRRIGKFEATRELISDDWDTPAVRLLMSMIVVVKCEFDYATQCFQYTAMSPHFDELPDHCEVPEYRWIVHMGEGGSMRLEAERLTDPPTPMSQFVTKRRRIIEEV